MSSPKRTGPGTRSTLPEPLRVFSPVNDWKFTTCGTGEGLLVEPQSLERAEAECEADEETCAIRRERAGARRMGEDQALVRERIRCDVDRVLEEWRAGGATAS